MSLEYVEDARLEDPRRYDDYSDNEEDEETDEIRCDIECNKNCIQWKNCKDTDKYCV
jgi:hypothetical protein